MGVLQSLGLVGRRILSAPSFCYKDVRYLGFLPAGRLLGAYLALAFPGDSKKPVKSKKLNSLWVKNHAQPIYYRSHTSDCLVIHHVLADQEYGVLGHLKAPKLVMDCGANIGCASLFFLRQYPDAHVIAVEADPDNHAICLMNLAGFGQRAKVMHAAVSASNSRFIVEKGKGGEWSSTVRPCRPGESGDVDGVTIDEVLNGTGHDRIDILKIDIEGAERMLFDEKCDRWLTRTNNLAIELHDEECHAVFFRTMERYSYELSNVKNLTFCRNLKPSRLAGASSPAPLIPNKPQVRAKALIKMPKPKLLSRIFFRIVRDIKRLFGVESYLRNEDRRVLEQVIFPYFLQEDKYKDVLFVGCHWYTRGYNRGFEERKNYWTIEIDSRKKKFGARQHIVDGMQNIRKHFKLSSLDLILCNGVFGWGLDAKPDVEQAFQACFECLRSGGVLVVGWDDIDERRPFPLDECQSLKRFKPFTFAPLSSAEYVTNTLYRHTYTFVVKEPENGQTGQTF